MTASYLRSFPDYLDVEKRAKITICTDRRLPRGSRDTNVRPLRCNFDDHPDFVPDWREPVWDTQLDVLVIGDGRTPLSELERVRLPQGRGR